MSSRSRAGGFTLVEVMIVVVIIGIMVSLVSFTVRSPSLDDLMYEESERIRALIGIAKQEAVLKNEEISIVFFENEYGFEILEEDVWRAYEHKLLGMRKLPEGMNLAIDIEDTAVIITTAPDDENEERTGDPVRAFILSSGEMTPFVLYIRADDESFEYRIVAEEYGDVKLYYPGEDLEI